MVPPLTKDSEVEDAKNNSKQFDARTPRRSLHSRRDVDRGERISRRWKVGKVITFRPPLNNGIAEDEIFIDGEYFIHVERMDTNHIWVGISSDDSMTHLNFVVENGELVLRVEHEKK